MPANSSKPGVRGVAVPGLGSSPARADRKVATGGEERALVTAATNRFAAQH